MRQRAARESGAGAARNHRHRQGVAQLEDLDHLLLGFRQHDDHRQLPVERQSIALVGARVLFAKEDRRFGQDAAQAFGNRALTF